MSDTQTIEARRELAAHMLYIEMRIASVHGYLTAADIEKRDRLRTLAGWTEDGDT